MEMEIFLEKLSSSDPTPGGGGVAAVSAALSSALCSMVANLTTGKKKYAQYQSKIENIIEQTQERTKVLYSYIEKDAKCFEPLSKAYGIPKDNPEREEILQKALLDAAKTPLELLKELEKTALTIEDLSVMGSKLAISDVAVAACMLTGAAQSAVMNVYINTKLMSDEKTARSMNDEANEIVSSISGRMNTVYIKVTEELIKK